MRTVYLIRYDSDEQGTAGILSIGGDIFTTIELPYKDNRPNISCIPCGEYECSAKISNRYGSVYHVKDVRGRSHILIHNGNFAGDASKGYKTHSQGCIIIGKKRGYIHKQKAVMMSRFARAKFENIMGYKPFRLIISNL